MKILVTGGSGQLALALQRQRGNHSLITFRKKDLDITDQEQLKNIFEREKPEVVINCAAWTDVDACESNQQKAFAVNGHAVGSLAESARQVGAQLVQISTDYVFDGQKGSSYLETDPTNPQSIYGKSKLLGEQLAGVGALIVRTAWLMGPDGNNMLQTILRLLRNPGDLYFVDDQVGCPTFTGDLAGALLALVEAKDEGIFHVTNAGPVSWFVFAQEVAEAAGHDPGRVLPISTTDLVPSRPAPRPANSVLDNLKLVNSGYPKLASHLDRLNVLLK